MLCRGKKIALDVARGLVHLHSRDIVHMDLKSPNILLGKDLTAKIADVGLARTVSNTSNTMTAIGTMAWAAPELKRNFRIGKQAAQKVRLIILGPVMSMANKGTSCEGHTLAEALHPTPSGRHL